MGESGGELTPEPAPVPPVDQLVAPRLTGAQVALLGRYGVVRPVVAGQVLFREGDRDYEFMVILSGVVTMVDHQAGVERELATCGPGEFVPGLTIFTGERLFITAVVTEPGSILVVAVDRLRELIGRDQELGGS